MGVFWANGFAATSTEDLTAAMGIGRQSLYNTFGDKRRLYAEALGAYQRRSIGGHLTRLSAPQSPLDGLRALLIGLAPEDDALRRLGCMGVASVSEFGAGDAELADIRHKAGAALRARIAERISEGQAQGEIATDLSPLEAAAFIQMTMAGLQMAARGGAAAEDLRRLAEFTTDRLRAP